MSQAALDAYLDYGEGYPDCPACGDNSYVYPAIVTDLDIQNYSQIRFGQRASQSFFGPWM